MDTPNINGAKTTTLPATLAGGWYTQLTERTKRSRHSWSMIPFTEPSYSVPDGNSRKIGEANIPSIFTLQTNPNNESNAAEPDCLKDALRDVVQAEMDNIGAIPRELSRETPDEYRRSNRNMGAFKRRASVLGEELVRYIATGTSISDYTNQDVREMLNGAVQMNMHSTGALDAHTWMQTVMTGGQEIRFNEWGAGGPVAWLYEMSRNNEGLENPALNGFDQYAEGFTGKRLKAPVLVYYLNDPRLFNRPLSQADSVEGAALIPMDIAAMTGAGMQVVYASNIDDASAMISSDPFGNTIAVYSHNRDTHVLCHPTLYNQYGYRLRRILQDLGPLRPAVCHLGLGHLGSATGNLQRPTLGWSVGQLQYNGTSYRADGSIYIPSDYHPYSLLKRTAKFNHIVTQVGVTWMGSFGAYGCGDEDGYMPRRGTNGTIAPMLQLLWGEQFGYTASPSIPTEPFFEPETVGQRMDEHIISTFGSGILAFDAGANLDGPLDIVNALAPFMNEGPRVSSLWAGTREMGPINEGPSRTTIERVWGLGLGQNFYTAMYSAFDNLGDFGISRSVEHVWAAVKAAIGPLFQVPMTPMTMLHSGGPRPGHVVERLQMNFRPDMAISGGTAGTKPYFLMPTCLNPGQVLTRLPCFLDINAGEAAANPNTWLGPRDPTVLTGVETIHYDGDRPREMSDPDYALESPVIIRDASVGTVEKNGRPCTIHRIPRPAYHRNGASFVGVFNTLTHGIESANGNYFMYPCTFEDHEDPLHYESGRGILQMTGVTTGMLGDVATGEAGGAVLSTNTYYETVGQSGQQVMTGDLNEPLRGLPAMANGQSIGIDVNNLPEIVLRNQAAFQTLEQETDLELGRDVIDAAIDAGEEFDAGVDAL